MVKGGLSGGAMLGNRPVVLFSFGCSGGECCYGKTAFSDLKTFGATVGQTWRALAAKPASVRTS